MIITGLLKSRNKLLRRLSLGVEGESAVVPPDLDPRWHVVLKGRPPDWPESCFVRLYRRSRISVGIRHMYVKTLVSRSAVRVPATLAYGFARFGHQIVFAVLEEPVPGQHPERWSPDMAQSLGQDLARWHKTRITRWARALIRLLDGAEAYRRLAAWRATLLRDPYRPLSLLSELERSLQTLDCPDFRGPIVLSHGDLQRRNMIVGEEGQLVWLDLDGACQRPCRHDLAIAEVLLLRQDPDALDAFEEQYFDIRAGEQQAWRRHRLGWLRVASSLWALQMLTPLRKPLEFGPWQRMWLAISSACWEVEDVGQPSGALVGEISELAERKLRAQAWAQ